MEFWARRPREQREGRTLEAGSARPEGSSLRAAAGLSWRASALLPRHSRLFPISGLAGWRRVCVCEELRDCWLLLRFVFALALNSRLDSSREFVNSVSPDRELLWFSCEFLMCLACAPSAPLSSIWSAEFERKRAPNEGISGVRPSVCRPTRWLLVCSSRACL